MEANTLVEKYIQLRDVKQKLNKKHKEKLERIDGVLDKIESALLKEFQSSGVESVRTKAGTAYKANRTSATVADWDQVLNFIREHDLWAMLERRVSKEIIEQYKAENGALPPGVNWYEEVVVNIRRS